MDTFHLYSLRPTYGAKPNFISRNELPNAGFASLYGVDAGTAQALQQAGTTTGFKGVVWTDRLWLDIDNYTACEAVEERLRRMNVDFVGYDTGGRGGHFGVRRDAHPSHLLPAMDRQWAEANIPEADRCIYTHLHPFRLPGTVHDSTGRTKREACSARGSSLTLPPFTKQEMPTIPNSGGQRQSVFDCPRVMMNSAPNNGARHPQLLRLAYALRDLGVSNMEARWWIAQVNMTFEMPKDEAYLDKLVGSIFI
jgi:hypothetical protein